ncbi:MAG: putative rane protein, partial [Verrucomicrobiales bacterium]|nr:putative rane protein [Verrucomicrobiales bacterium]
GDPPAEATDLLGALLRVLEQQPRLAAVVLASDGDWNTGPAPSQAATRLRMKGVPVFAVPLGADTRLPDVEIVSFDVPTFAVAGKPLRIPFSIDSALPRDEMVGVTMTTSAGEQIRQEFTLPAMGRLQDAIVWRPGAPGKVELTLEIPKTGAERNTDNNKITANLDIRQEQLRVLVVESYPRWEYRYLRNALERDPGVEVNTLLFQPDLGKPGAGRGYLSAFPEDDALTKYDVVILGDVGVEKGQLTAAQCTSIVKLVRDQASGLVFMPGLRGYTTSLLGTGLSELLPVVWDEAQPRGWGTASPGRLTLTEAGTDSLLTKLEDTGEASARVWAGLPGFQWYAPALRAKAGTEILATHATETNQFGRIPLIVTRTFGAGKILYMGSDGAWRWRRGVEDKYHYRFWGQVARWMAYQRNMAQGEKMRLFFAPDRPRTGGTLTLNANVISLTGEPLRDGVVIAEIVSASGRPSSVRLLPAGAEAWGLFTGVFTPTEPGDYQVRLTCAEAGTALETVVSVQGTRKEKRGQPARPEVLREIAQLTRGQLLESATPAAVLAAVSSLPPQEVIERRLQIWAHPAWAGTLIVLLTIFWIGRKAAGVF